MNQRVLALVVVLICSGILSACQRSGAPQSDVERLEGIFGEQVVFDSEADTYLIGKDMHLDKASAAALADEVTAQQRYYSRVGPKYAGDITYYFDPAVPNEWRWAHNEAVARFNALDTALRFRRVETCRRTSYLPEGCDIYVEAANNWNSWVALASLPLPEATDFRRRTSRPQNVAGRFIAYNTRYTESSWQWRVRVALHELGHTVGLAHDFDENGVVVPGTPARDDTSIMSYTGNVDNFSPDDVRALETLYPKGQP